MNNRAYIIAHGTGEDFAIDGVCQAKEAAERLCAVYNDSVGKDGLCYVERRVIPINRFADAPAADGKIVYKVSVQFSASGKGNRKIGKGKLLSGITDGICYFDGKKRKPYVTEGDRKWIVDIFVESGTDEDSIILSAKEALEKQLAEWDAEPGVSIA